MSHVHPTNLFLFFPRNANQSLTINSSALPHPHLHPASRPQSSAALSPISPATMGQSNTAHSQFGRSSDRQHLIILPPEISGQSASASLTPSGQSANTLVGPSANASCTLVGPSPTSDSTLAVQCANVSTLPGQTVNLPLSAQPLAHPSASRESPAATGFFDDDVVM